MTPCGFPHSEIRGSKLICSSPQLIAAYHVFLRLPVPRHSPCALLRLTVLNPLILHLPTKKFSVFEIAVSNYITFLASQLLFSFQGANLRHKFANISQVKCCTNSCLEPPCIDSLYFAFASYKPLHPAASGRSSCFHKKWWAQVDSNHRPRAYQARALTT